MHTRELTRHDLPSVVQISHDTFLDNELNEFLWPSRKQYPADYFYNLLLLARKRLVEPGIAACVIVADEEDVRPSGPNVGEIMGFGWFKRLPHGAEFNADTIPISATLDRKAAEAKAKSDQQRNTGPTAAFERALVSAEGFYARRILNRFRSESAENRELFFSLDAEERMRARLPSHWYASLLGCNPSYEGRGVGSRIVEYGKKLAWESGVPLSLTSSPGRPQFLYTKKQGMKIVAWAEVPGYDFDGGAQCIWDPWGLWMKSKETPAEDVDPRRPITGELIY